jgi:uncharacterized membrane protein YwzB
MFFEIVLDTYKLIFSIIFIIMFVISYYVIIASRFESLFKQGKIWQIRVGQILLALIIAFLATEAIMLLFPAEIS